MNKLEKAISMSYSDDAYTLHSHSECDPATSMGEIARMDEVSLLSEDKLTSKKIIFQGASQDKLINQLRDIRTALNKNKNKNKNNLIMLVSVDEKSGTSFFAKNIAAVSAFDSSRTSLLVDCNITAPSVAETFELTDKRGLLDYIFDKDLKEEDIIQAVGIQRYRCITAGNIKLGDDEYFTHPRFKALLIALKNRYADRNIFLDAPPLLKSANARILLELCDRVIVVAPFGKVERKKLESIYRIIPAEKLSGVVINDYIN